MRSSNSFKFFRFLVILTVLEVVGLAAPLAAAPCENGQIRSREEAFEQSSAIFVGRVVQMEEVGIKGMNYQSVKLEVDTEKSPSAVFFKGEDYRGKLEKSIHVIMPLEGENVQLLRIGKTYLVYAVEDAHLEKLFTNLCWRNSAVSDDGLNPDIDWLVEKMENLKAVISPEPEQPQSLPEVLPSDPEN